ncbi:MAG: spermidine/putrescine ABC transporter substrate-binding protein [Anaerolineales bacterium]
MNDWHNKRRLVSLLILVALFLSACGNATNATPEHYVTSNGFECPAPSPRLEVTSKQLNLFTWTEYVPQDIIDCFGLVYGVDVNVGTFSSNEELQEKLAAGKGTNAYDLVHPSDYMVEVLIRTGVLQKLDKSKLPNLKNLDQPLLKTFGNTTDFIVPYQMGTDAIVYNSDTVKTPPTSWADLWNPEYKGRIVAVDDPRVMIGAALLVLGYDVNSTDEAQLEAAKQKLLELKPNIRVYDSDSPKTPLLAGDVDLGVVWNGEAFLAYRENPAMTYVFPKEGTINFYDGLGLPTDAPHPDLAYAWLNYMLQGDVFWLTLQDYPYTIPNKAALDYAKENQPEIYKAYIESPITNTPADIFAKGFDVKDIGGFVSKYDEVWTEIK